MRDAMIEGNIDPQAEQQIVSYLPSDRASLDKIGERSVFSFHYYDPIAITQSLLKSPIICIDMLINGLRFLLN